MASILGFFKFGEIFLVVWLRHIALRCNEFMLKDDLAVPDWSTGGDPGDLS